MHTNTTKKEGTTEHEARQTTNQRQGDWQIRRAILRLANTTDSWKVQCTETDEIEEKETEWDLY